MNRKLQISFRLFVGEEQILVDELLQNHGKLLDYYLSDEWWSDSTFKGGYCIAIDNNRWNGKDEYLFDLFRYSLQWVSGIVQLLSTDQTTVSIGFWEESTGTATRVGENELEIVDTWVSSNEFMSKPACVNLEVFSKQLLRESKKYLKLAMDIKDEINLRQSQIDKKAALRIIEEMCGEDFEHYCGLLEDQINKRFGIA